MHVLIMPDIVYVHNLLHDTVFTTKQWQTHTYLCDQVLGWLRPRKRVAEQERRETTRKGRERERVSGKKPQSYVGHSSGLPALERGPSKR